MSGARDLVLLGPFALLGALSGTLVLLSRSPRLSQRARRLCGIAWAPVLLAGGPLWLLLWAELGL